LYKVPDSFNKIIRNNRFFDSDPYLNQYGGVRLEEFGWFGGMLEEFVREKHCSG